MRKIFTDKKYDITILEIKENDHLNGISFLEIDDKIFIEDPNTFFKNKSIYSIHYPKGEKVEYSIGIIKGISEDKYNIRHLCSTETGSSGCPLINLYNHKVIGVHKGNDKGKNWNLGTLLGEPILLLNKKYYVNNDIFNQNQNGRIESHQINLNNNIINSNKQIINTNQNLYNNIINNNNQRINLHKKLYNNIISYNYLQIQQTQEDHPINNIYTQLPNYNYNNIVINKNSNTLTSNNNALLINSNKAQILSSNLNNKNIDMGDFNKQISIMNSNNRNYFNNIIYIIEDPYPYIKGEKKVIVFINLYKVYKKVKIPISLRKNEIYATAEKYKSGRYSKIIKLIHNKKELENDESNIDGILNGDMINIEEDFDINLSYNSILQKHKRPLIYNICFCDDRGESCSLFFPDDTIEKEVMFAGFNQLKIPYEYKNDFSVFRQLKTPYNINNEICYSYNNYYLNQTNSLLKDLRFDKNSTIFIENNLQEHDERKKNIYYKWQKNRMYFN